jgi:hypothetical protein
VVFGVRGGLDGLGEGRLVGFSAESRSVRSVASKSQSQSQSCRKKLREARQRMSGGQVRSLACAVTLHVNSNPDLTLVSTLFPPLSAITNRPGIVSRHE